MKYSLPFVWTIFGIALCCSSRFVISSPEYTAIQSERLQHDSNLRGFQKIFSDFFWNRPIILLSLSYVNAKIIFQERDWRLHG